MKIAVPTNGKLGLKNAVGEHFGRVETYTLFDTESKEVEIIDNTSHHMGGMGYPPELLAEKKVDILLCSGLGKRAIDMFSERKIDVFCGAKGTVEDALNQWKNNELVLATENSACTKRVFHDEKNKRI